MVPLDRDRDDRGPALAGEVELEFPPDGWNRLPDGACHMNEPNDPFAHLHDEAYADPYQAGLVGHDHPARLRLLPGLIPKLSL